MIGQCSYYFHIAGIIVLVLIHIHVLPYSESFIVTVVRRAMPKQTPLSTVDAMAL